MANDTRLQQVADKAVKYARKEIQEYGAPDLDIFNLSLEKGRQLADRLSASRPLVEICVAMMDLKLGQSQREKRVPEHVQMSADAATEFLSQENVTAEETATIINAVEAHHGGVPFAALEAEIATNADCYRFLHPRGIFIFFSILRGRLGSVEACFGPMRQKMDEKAGLLSLDVAKEELLPVYEDFKRHLEMAKE